MGNHGSGISSLHCFKFQVMPIDEFRLHRVKSLATIIILTAKVRKAKEVSHLAISLPESGVFNPIRRQGVFFVQPEVYVLQVKAHRHAKAVLENPYVFFFFVQ